MHCILAFILLAQSFGGFFPSYPVPMPASQGGIASSSGPPIANGDTIWALGDSITAGTGASTCSSGTAAHVPTGTCYLDQFGLAYTNVQVANQGIAGTCLESPCFTGSTNAGFDRYTTALSGFLSNPSRTWYVILYGANDISSTLASNVATPERYYTQLNTIVQYMISQGISSDHIIIGSILPQSTSASQTRYPIFYEISAAAARVAALNRTRYADTYGSVMSCWVNAQLIVSGTTVCSGDGLHPNDTGHALLASAFENANFQNALSANESYNVASNVMQFPYFLNILTGSITASGNITSSGGSISCNCTASGTAVSNGINANGNGLTNSGASAPNPALLIFNNPGNPWGQFLWHDGTGYSYGTFEPTTFRGWNWLTFPSGSWPTAVNGFTSIARLDPSGNLSLAGGIQAGNQTSVTAYPWHPSSDPTCSIAAAGTACSTTTTMPVSGMRCGVVLIDTGTIGGVIVVPSVGYSGTTLTLYATALSSIAGGGTAAFSVSCD